MKCHHMFDISFQGGSLVDQHDSSSNSQAQIYFATPGTIFD